MPEGHTIHRAARVQASALGTDPIAVTSPQGRFAHGASILDGGRIESIEAVGKHLFYHWDRRPVLHVHLGLVGRFRIHRNPPVDVSRNARLAMEGDAVVSLSGPQTCELLDPLQVDQIRKRLGPDPLDPEADPAPFIAALSGRSTPIAASLLDQSAIAGVGNVYRAEMLFLAGIHPDRRSSDVTEDEALGLWRSAVDLLSIGERIGRIVTVHPREVGAARPEDIPQPMRLYVYKRSYQPCFRCGTEIRGWEIGGRTVWACARCQPD
jgi:endonuclease-8